MVLFIGYRGGFFSNFLSILGFLELYERGVIGGLEVDLRHGLYNEPAYGPNWWNYYFEPIKLGSPGIEIASDRTPWGNVIGFAEANSRERNYYLINKYIHVRPDIITTALPQDCIALHYRGGDKIHHPNSEGDLVNFGRYIHYIEERSTAFGDSHPTIFVASDEAIFPKWISEFYPGRVVSSTSTQWLDGWNEERGSYQQGLEALVDMLQLSQCSTIIRSSSNLGLVATFFNPTSYNVVLSKRNHRPNGWQTHYTNTHLDY